MSHQSDVKKSDSDGIMEEWEGTSEQGVAPLNPMDTICCWNVRGQTNWKKKGEEIDSLSPY